MGRLLRGSRPTLFWRRVGDYGGATLCAVLASGVMDTLISPANVGRQTREYWAGMAVRIADPVLMALSQNRLKATMPVTGEDRRQFSHLEALGRLLAGVAPWLELPPDDTPEGMERGRLLALAVRSIGNAVDPDAPDYLNFSHGSQPLVDAAFLAHALLRAPGNLWGSLDETTRTNLAAAFRQTRRVKPGENNWLLFTAMVETTLWRFTGEGDVERIEYAVNRHLEWYKGDGVYGDGPSFHWDYYNSFVIQPMLLDVVDFLRKKKHPLGEHYPVVLERARRYAAVQEQLISPEGTFPILGRSSTYRFGAFQTLAQIALTRELTPQTSPGAVRAGPDGGHQAMFGSTGHVRRRRLAADRRGRTSAVVARELHFHGQPVPLLGRSVAARSAAGRSVLDRARCHLDPETYLGGRGRDGGSSHHELMNGRRARHHFISCRARNTPASTSAIPAICTGATASCKRMAAAVDAVTG